jgi:hypothetical protein
MYKDRYKTVLAIGSVNGRYRKKGRDLVRCREKGSGRKIKGTGF